MPSGAPLRRSSVVVGRAAELDLLRRTVERAPAGGSSCVVLVGEGGIGKTRLLTEATTFARQRSIVVLGARSPIATPAPYSVVAEALRGGLRAVPELRTVGSYDRGLALVLPEWSSGTEPVATVDAPHRLLALEAIVQLLRAMAASAGALLVVDDVHAADAESIEALRYIANAAVDGLVMLVALRPGEEPAADELLRMLRRDLVTDIVELDPLDERAVGDLVAALLDSSAPAALIADVVERTDGVPLLVEEVVLAHVRADTVVHGGTANVPRSVRDLADARLQLLTGRQRNVVVAGAVVGDFEPSLMTAVGDADDDTVSDALTAGVRVGLLETSGGAIAFRHAIIREAVIDATVPHLVDAMHRRAATALAARNVDDARRLERLAHHLAVIGEMDAAAEALTNAARIEVRGHALLAAERTARRALELARAPAARAASADALATVLVAQGRWSDALALDETTAAEHGTDPTRRRRMATAALEIGRPDEAEALIAGAISDGDDDAAMVLLDGRAAVVRGDAERALARARRVLDDPATDIDERLAALDLEARAFDFLGDRAAAEQTWERQAREAAAAKRTQAQLRAAVQLGKLELFAGRPPARLHEAVELARAAGALVELGWAQENLAIGLSIHGDIAGGMAVVEDAIARCEALGLDQLAYLLASRAMSASFLGEDYERDLDAAEAMLPTLDMQLHTNSMRGDIALRAGDADEAIRWFERCNELLLAMPGVVPMDAPCWLVWAYAAAGRTDDARAALARARAMPDVDRWYGRPLVIAMGEAMLANDVDHLDELFAAAESSAPIDVAVLRQLSASIIGGERRTAWLRAALETFERAGATLQAERTRQQLRAAGGAVPRRRRPKIDVPDALAKAGVTAREADVLRLLGDGLPNADIAERLFVSVRTVESHVSSLLVKLAARNRGQLTAISAATAWST